jgi:hypothetical protein
MTEEFRFDFRLGQEIFLFSMISRSVLGPLSLLRLVLEAVSPRVQRQTCEADRCPPSNAEVKNSGAAFTPSNVYTGVVLNQLCSQIT